MKTSERQELVTHYLERRKAGTDISAIRKELLLKGHSDTTIQLIMNQIESEFIKSSSARSWSKPFKAKLKIWFGGFLFALGIVATILSFTPYTINSHESIWVGHILSGSLLYYLGKREQRKLQITGKRKFETKLEPR